jgi:cell division protein FtsX
MTDEIKEEVQENIGQEPEGEKQPAPPDLEKPLDKMTAPELREIAIKLPGVTGVHAMKKEQLLAAIKEAWGIKEEETAKTRKKKAKKKAMGVKEIKEKIARLKVEKSSAREAQEGKKVDRLRRRINRLKKQSRKVAQA